MALMRWEPMAEMDSMRRLMDRMMGELGGGRLFAGMPTLEGGRGFAPSVEVYTTEDEVVVSAELPGIRPEDVAVELTEQAVHLSGELKKETEIKEDNYYRTERQYGHFERIVPLPERIKDDQAKATFKHGVLTIRAPFAEPVKKPQARKLQIEQEG